jgi:hypothetical protein
MTPDSQKRVLELLADGACRTSDWLIGVTGWSAKGLGQAMGKLVMRRFVERAERGCFTLSAKGRAFLASGAELTCAPNTPRHRQSTRRQDTRRERLWRAIRARAGAGTFTVADLLPLALQPDESEVAALHDAQYYCNRLAGCGVLLLRRRLRRDASVAPGRGAKTYSLARDLGPLPPMIVRSKGTIYDPNSRTELAPLEPTDGQ